MGNVTTRFGGDDSQTAGLVAEKAKREGVGWLVESERGEGRVSASFRIRF
jgi:hypothetical protein